MPRTIWTKLQTEPNGSWSRHEGEPPFSVPATGGLSYDVRTDMNEVFAITPLMTSTAPMISSGPTISGTPEVGQTLTATAAPSTGTAPITTTWQWLRDGAEIPDATGGTYLLVSADESTDTSVRQTDTNAYGSDSAVSAELTIAAAPEAPVISGAPVLSGVAQVGETLTAKVAPSTGTEPIDTTWQWLRDDVEIPDATVDTYALLSVDEGAAICVRQTDTNVYGSDSAVSAAQTVQAAPIAGTVVISALSVSDQTATGDVELTYSISKDSSVDGVLSRSVTKPSAAQINAGQDHSGAPADSTFSDVWVIGAGETLSDIPAGLPTDIYYVHVVPAGGGDGDVVTSNGFILETVAPTVSGAETDSAGSIITLSMSETVAGTGDPGNWTINGVSAGTSTIDSVSVSDTTISIQISGNLIAEKDIVTLDYSGDDITDAVSNALLDFSGLSVTNKVSGGFSETLVTVSDSAYLAAPAGAPSGTNSVLFFFSGVMDGALTTRAMLSSWGGTNEGIWGRYATDRTYCGFRTRIYTETTNIMDGGEPALAGDRYHTLGSMWVDGTSLHLKASVWMASSGWVDAFTGTLAPVGHPSDTIVNMITTAQTLFISTNDRSKWRGQCARIAMWAGANGAEIADPGSADVQSNFVNGGSIIDPATARRVYGTPLYDFSGPASQYNSGSHDGSLGNFTVNGTFI